MEKIAIQPVWVPAWLAATLVLTPVCGCRAPAVQEAAPPPVLRLLDQPAQEIFDVSFLLRQEIALRCDFTEPGALEGWQLTGAAGADLVPGVGLRLRPDGGVVTLTRAVDFNAEAAEQLTLSSGDLDGVTLSFSWARQGESFSDARTARIYPRGGGGLPREISRLALAGHPGWAGRVTRLRLVAETGDRRRLRLGLLTLGAEVPDEERFSAVLERPWLIDHQHQVRTARLAPPGRPIEWTVDVPEAAWLSLSYGVPAGAATATTFRVYADSGAEAPAVLLEDRIGPGAGDASVWHDAQLDLAAYEGTSLGLRFETSADETFDPRESLPFWGGPEIIRRSTRASTNLILISVDTLRADHLSLYGYHRETSPNLDLWARRFAVVFENTVASSPWTLPSHASLFSGLDAHRHGVNYFVPAGPSLSTLGERLWQAGFRTLAVTGSGLMHPRWGLAQGFDVYRYSSASNEQELAAGVDKALEMIEDNRHRRFFLFFHTYEVHEPLRPRPPYFDRFSSFEPRLLARTRQRPGLDPETHLHQNYFVTYEANDPGSERPLPAELSELPIDLYDSGIAYADAQLNRLLERIERLGLASRTLVVFTSDHGEMLGEHDLAGHAFLYDENLMVPLVMRIPHTDGGRRIRPQVRSIDVLPTVLDILDLELPSALDGVSLLPLIEGRSDAAPEPALSYAASGSHGLSLRVGNRLKYVLRNSAWKPQRDVAELFDLANDPRELQNRAADHLQRHRLRGRLEQEFATEAVGLWLRFSNEESSAFSGTLHGADIVNSVKSIDLECDCLRRMSQDTIRFKVPPGSDFGILLEYVPEGRIHLRLSHLGSERPVYDSGIELARLRGPLTLIHGTSGWQETSSPAADGGAAITLVLRGDPESGETSLGGDADLRQRLRTLGYID